MLGNEEGTAPVPAQERPPTPSVREVMGHAMSRLEQANTQLDGRLAIGIGTGATRTLLFESPLTRQVTQPDGTTQEVADFLVVAQGGYKTIEVDTSAPIASWDLNRAELSRGVVSDVQAHIAHGRYRPSIFDSAERIEEDRQRHEKYWGSEKVGYIEGTGLVTGDVVISDTGTTTQEIVGRKPDDPNEYIWQAKRVPGISLVESPAPEVVSDILKLNKERAEKQKAEAEKMAQVPPRQEQDLKTATAVNLDSILG